MPFRLRTLAPALLALAIPTGRLYAEPPKTAEAGAQLSGNIQTDEGEVAAKPPAKSTDENVLSVTQHEAVIGGETIRYTATAGTLPLKNDEGKTTANVFFVAYTKDGVEDMSRRPVTFAFNGGPGSSSVWLHLGMLAPRRVKLAEAPETTAPPYQLVENEDSLLDRTDLVFIDPVSTGYSRPASGEEKKQFHGYEEDIRSVGEFIHRYVTRHGRWLSPRFLLGESYGGLRAAGLAGHLLERYNMTLNGVVLVSAVLDFQTLDFDVSNDLPYVLFLPSYTATAWHHKQLPEDLQRRELADVLKEVERFAQGEYTLALMRGAKLPQARQEQVAEKLSRYTGLSKDYVLRSNLRVEMSRFAKELLRDERRTVGRFDSRYVGIDRDHAADSYEYDPSGAALFGPFTAALYDYLRDELQVVRDVPYEILTSKVHPWNYQGFQNRYVDASDTLRRAMTKTPYLKVFVATGLYDLATPHLAMEYTMNHLALDPSLRKNVTIARYPAGHMMYVHEPSLRQLKQDLDRFYRQAVSR